MGSCHQKNQIIKPPINPASNYLADIKNKLMKLIQVLSENFEKSVQKKIKPNKPKVATEVSEIIEISMRKVVQEFENSVKEYKDEVQLERLIHTYKLYLTSKCKSKEGFFRNQNDYFSFKYIINLIKFLLGKIKSNGITEKDSIELYSKLAKGGYMIMGLNEYTSLLRLSYEEKEQYLKKLEETEMAKFRIEKSELIDAANEDWSHFEVNSQNNYKEADYSKIFKSTEDLKEFLKN